MRPRVGNAPLPRVTTTPLSVQVSSPSRLVDLLSVPLADRPGCFVGGLGVPLAVELGAVDRVDLADLMIGELELDAPGPDLEIALDVQQQAAVALKVGVGLQATRDARTSTRT